MATESVETDALINIGMCSLSINNVAPIHGESRKQVFSVKPTRSRSLETANVFSWKQNLQRQEASSIVLCRDQAATRAAGLRRRPCFHKASSCRDLLEKPKSILKPTSSFIKSNSMINLEGSSAHDENEENGERFKLDCKRRVKHNVSFEEMNRWGNGSSKSSDSFLLHGNGDEEEEEAKEQTRLPAKLKQHIGLEQMNRWGNSCSESSGSLRFDLDEILRAANGDANQENGNDKIGLVSSSNEMKLESRDKFDRWGSGSEESSNIELNFLRLDNDGSPTVSSNGQTLSPEESKTDFDHDSVDVGFPNSSVDLLPRVPNRRKLDIKINEYSEEGGPRSPKSKASMEICDDKTSLGIRLSVYTNEFLKRKA